MSSFENVSDMIFQNTELQANLLWVSRGGLIICLSALMLVPVFVIFLGIGFCGRKYVKVVEDENERLSELHIQNNVGYGRVILKSIRDCKGIPVEGVKEIWSVRPIVIDYYLASSFGEDRNKITFTSN